MRIAIAIVVGILLFILLWNTTAYRDVDKLKEQAPTHLEELGFDVIGYNGYTGDFTYGGSTYYLVKREEQPTILYEVAVAEWRGEIQSWKPQVVNENIVMN